MRKKLINNIFILLILIAILGGNYGSVKAETIPEQGESSTTVGGGSISPEGNGTDVFAGVTLDYMGRLKFLVRDKDSLEPIEGATVEIYIPALDRYVFFGLTDGNGIYELDVQYKNEGDDTDGQFVYEDGKMIFKGKIMFLDDNLIKWRVYKEGYLLYPERGEVNLTTVKLPHQIDVYLYKKTKEPDSTFDVRESESEDQTSGPSGKNDGKGKYGKLPKTGIENAITLWSVGLVLCITGFFLLLLLWSRSKDEQKNEQQK